MKEKITSNVLEDISRRLGGRTEGGKNRGRGLVLITGSRLGLENRIGEIGRLREKGIDLSLGLSFMAEGLLDSQKIVGPLKPRNIYREKDIFRLGEINEEYSFIIGPNITMNSLSKISLGLIDSLIPNLIWTFLYQEKPVYLDFSSIRNYMGLEGQNQEILRQIEGYIKSLKTMGAIELREGNYLDSLGGLGGIKKNPSKAKEEENEDEKRVIIESDILALAANSSLSLSRGSIVTPLAKDRAREKNIRIEIKGG